MDELLKATGGALERLLSTGGVTGACLILALAACALLFRRLSQSEERLRTVSEEYARDLRAMYETRLTESQKTLSTVEANARAIVGLDASMSTRTAAFSAVVSGFEVLSATLRSHMESSREQLNRIEREMADARRAR